MSPAVRKRRTLILFSGMLFGLAVGLALALPVPDTSAQCPPGSDGWVRCVLDHAWLAALTKVMICAGAGLGLATAALTRLDRAMPWIRAMRYVISHFDEVTRAVAARVAREAGVVQEPLYRDAVVLDGSASGLDRAASPLARAALPSVAQMCPAPAAAPDHAPIGVQADPWPEREWRSQAPVAPRPAPAAPRLPAAVPLRTESRAIRHVPGAGGLNANALNEAWTAREPENVRSVRVSVHRRWRRR